MKNVFNMKNLSVSLLLLFATVAAFSQEKKTITVQVDGDKMIVNEGPIRKAQLGVRVMDAIGETKGAVVAEVVEGSPAETLGLKEGDVIVSINNKVIEDAKSVADYIGGQNAGDEISVNWFRDGKKKQGKVKLAKAQIEVQEQNIERSIIVNGQPLSGDKQSKVEKRIIINGQPLTKEQIEKFEVEGFPMHKMQGNPIIENELKVISGLNGDGKQFNFEVTTPAPKIGFTVEDLEDRDAVKITDIKEDSQAAKAGLKNGDIVTAVDGKTIKNTDDLLKSVKQGKEKSSLLLGIERNGKSQTIEVKLPKKIKKVEL
jgi:serine protease Do